MDEKKTLAALLAAVLFCGLFTACGAEKDEEYSGNMELILTDWMRYISASEAMYEDMDWAVSYTTAFGNQPNWDALLCARAAVELAAKRIELRDEPAWDAPAEAYDYFTERKADVSFAQFEVENFESNRQALLTSCNTLRQHLMSDVFFLDGLPRTADAAETEAKINQASLEYLAYSTEYLLMELNDAEWSEKVHESMKEACPRIDAIRGGRFCDGGGSAGGRRKRVGGDFGRDNGACCDSGPESGGAGSDAGILRSAGF